MGEARPNRGYPLFAFVSTINHSLLASSTYILSYIKSIIIDKVLYTRMASAPNVYSAEPAFPVLAHSLLRRSESTQNAAPPSDETTAKNDWNLKNDWKQGIQSSKEAAFRYGVVLGFSRLRMRSNESYEYIGQV